MDAAWRSREQNRTYRGITGRVLPYRGLFAAEAQAWAKLRRWWGERPLPRVVWDIGANRGTWADAAINEWPSASIVSFEANPAMKEDLQGCGRPYVIAVLGDANRKVAMTEATPEALQRDALAHTGNSLFHQLGRHGGLYRNVSRQMRRLDDLVDELPTHCLPASARAPDFIKLDVQGAELAVLRGAPRALKTASHLLLELSVTAVNAGAPLAAETINWLREHAGFEMSLKIAGNDNHGQMDAIFSRTSGRTF